MLALPMGGIKTDKSSLVQLQCEPNNEPPLDLENFMLTTEGLATGSCQCDLGKSTWHESPTRVEPGSKEHDAVNGECRL